MARAAHRLCRAGRVERNSLRLHRASTLALGGERVDDDLVCGPPTQRWGGARVTASLYSRNTTAIVINEGNTLFTRKRGQLAL